MHPFILLLLVPAVAIGLCAAGFWIWMLIDCLNNKNLSGSQRCCWMMFIFWAHLIGAVVYYFVGRSQRISPIRVASPTSQRPWQKPLHAEADRSYQEGYPIQHFSRNTRASSEKVATEHLPMQSRTRYEKIQLAYPEDPH